MHACEKRSSLFRRNINDEEKSFEKLIKIYIF